MDATDRFGPDHIEAWRRDGAVVIPGFFTPGEVEAVQADFRTLFAGEGAVEAMDRKQGALGRFHQAQFTKIEPIPLHCSPALNLIGLHPALIAFAKAALKAEAVYLYQCQAWAKFTGEADYDQPFHCDFSNHTLTVPSEEPSRNSITILCYFSEVSEQHGPMHFVPRSESLEIAPPTASLNYDPAFQAELQPRLAAKAHSSAGPAGTAIPYSIDVFHRGTNLTAPGGHRYALMTCFRAAGDDTIDFTAWPFHHMKPWARIFDHASVEQLTCLGVKPPGNPFWTETTLAGAQIRYPGWNLEPWRKAAGQ